MVYVPSTAPCNAQTGTHLTHDFPCKINISLLFLFALTQFITVWSIQNFAHAMTAVLSWHVLLKFVVTLWPGIELHYDVHDVISIRFQFWVKSCEQNRFQTNFILTIYEVEHKNRWIMSYSCGTYHDEKWNWILPMKTCEVNSLRPS